MWSLLVRREPPDRHASVRVNDPGSAMGDPQPGVTSPIERCLDVQRPGRNITRWAPQIVTANYSHKTNGPNTAINNTVINNTGKPIKRVPFRLHIILFDDTAVTAIDGFSVTIRLFEGIFPGKSHISTNWMNDLSSNAKSSIPILFGIHDLAMVIS